MTADSEGFFKAIVETSPDVFWVIDLQGDTIYANSRLAHLYGVEEDALVDLTVFDTLDAEGRIAFAAHLVDLRAGVLIHHDVECLFVRKNGDTLWVLVKESPWLNESGELIGVVHRITEYHARRATHDQLVESRRRLEETQRIARVGGWEWDLLTNELIGTQALAELYGVSVEEFPRDVDSLFQMAHPDDLAEMVESMTPIGGGEDSFSFVARFRVDPTLDWLWIRARGVIQRDDAGQALHVSGTHQDVTELMLAESALEDQVAQNELLRAVASSANRASTLDEVLPFLRGLLLSHDDWTRARFYRVAEDQLVPNVVHPDDAAADLEFPATAEADLALAVRSIAENGVVWSPDGLVLAAPVVVDELIAAVLLIASAPPILRHAMIQESVESSAVQIARVIEREQSARTLSAARDAAMDASRQKSEFLATMSHEIRTPLNGVIGLNDLLMRSDLDESQRRLASGVQVAGRALLAVLNDVLDFSKIEAGMIDLESLDFDLRTVFEQVGDVLGESARSKGLELIMSCHPDVPEMVTGDPTRLAQVLTNLVSNAVKFTPSGEVAVRAVLESRDQDGVRVSIEVSDTGIGIDPQSVATLLEPFTQADSSTTRMYGGTGLGLAISQQLVQALGGELSYFPRTAGGSVFRFTALFAEASAQAAEGRDAEARSILSGTRVLVVDDNDTNRLILMEQVSHWNMSARDASSAEHALAEIQSAHGHNEPFDVVLMDYAMPGRDGLQLAHDIVGLEQTAPALIMLTSITGVDRSAVESAGFDECLTKPVPVDILRSVLMRRHGATAKIPTAAAEAGQPKHRRILVVEDNEVNQMVALGVLQSLGYDGEAVGDGAQAVARVERGDVHAVLMDVQMPVLDGYAATRAIRDAGHHRLPIIAMTAAAVEGERDRCLTAGMDAYLTKPMDPKSLAATLAEWLSDRTDNGSAPNESGSTESGDNDLEEPTINPTPPIDGLDTQRLDMLRDLDPGDTTYLDRAIGNFSARSQTVLTSLEEAIASDDDTQVRALAHKLSGSASNLGVLEASDDARDLELRAVDADAHQYATILERLGRSVAHGCELLGTYQATYSASTASTERPPS
ncbi:hypothetical protein GCM10027020_21200 [Nocardioides salsibiostraticola]